MMGVGRSSTFRDSRDSFSLDNGVTPCVEKTEPCKRLNRENHSHTTPFPSVNSVRGVKTSGSDKAEYFGGGLSIRKARR